MDPENILQMQYPEPPAPPAPGPIIPAAGVAMHHAPIHGNQSLPVPFIKFSGLPSEDFAVFERQIRSSIGLSAVPNGRRHHFLHLRLQEGALQFYEQLPNALRTDFEESLRQLRERYINPDQTTILRLSFPEIKFSTHYATPEDYLTHLQRIAARVFPVNQRNSRIREQFLSGMPATIRRKLYEIEEPAKTVNDLCNRVARIIVIEKLVTENDFATAFNVINSQPTKSEDFNFLQAQQQSLQETQQAIVAQIAQISSQLKSIEVQRQQDKANPTQSESRGSYNQQQQNYHSRCGYHRGGQHNSRGNGRVICRNCGKRGLYQKFCWYRNPPHRNT